MSQEHKYQKNSSFFDWAFLFLWMMATTLGWILGGILFTGLQELGSGLVVSIFQWFVLLGRIEKAWRWILFSTIGWVVGWLIAYPIVPAGFELANAMIIGAGAGLAQWLILRQAFHWSGWWVIISIMAWSTGIGLLPGAFLTGTLAGLITGTALGILIRFPKTNIVYG